MASPESLALAGAWLQKAAHDLATARLLVQEEKRLLDIAVYHCQQAAEKSLKGWLTAKEITFPKTHSLSDVLALCIPVNSAFADYEEHCRQLSPLVHEFRYPGSAAEPDYDGAAEALRLAEEVYAFCEQQLAG
ncbi:MAG: HEPN domain-containing protein [Chthoniobacterales bacterium]